MHKENYSKYFKLLEVDPDCNLEELTNSYNHLKKIFNTDTFALLPLTEEISDLKKKRIHKEMDEAYQILSDFLKSESKCLHQSKKEQSMQEITKTTAFSGAYFKSVREQRGLDISHLSFVTKIPKSTLIDIEEENFQKLPPRTYLFCQLKTYTNYLSLDPDIAASEYMKKYLVWQNKMKLTY